MNHRYVQVKRQRERQKHTYVQLLFLHTASKSALTVVWPVLGVAGRLYTGRRLSVNARRQALNPASSRRSTPPSPASPSLICSVEKGGMRGQKWGRETETHARTRARTHTSSRGRRIYPSFHPSACARKLTNGRRYISNDYSFQQFRHRSALVIHFLVLLTVSSSHSLPFKKKKSILCCVTHGLTYSSFLSIISSFCFRFH